MPHRHLRRRRHSNFLFLLLGLCFAFILSRLPFFASLITEIEKFGYLGAILSGFLFSSTFTAATGALLLVNFAKVLDPFYLVASGVVGALSADLIIFFFVKDKVSEEITPIYEHFLAHSHLKKIIHTKYFSWTLPVLGALIIASPFPDELGISLMGLSSIPFLDFLLISLLSHTFGIFLLVSASVLI